MKYTKTLFLASLLFFVSFFITHQVDAATLKFDNTSVTAKVNDTIDIPVVIDAGSDQILGVDSYIMYNPEHWEPQNITNGTYFPTVLNNTFSGKVYIAGIVNDPSSYKTGSGTLATITFKALKDSSDKFTFYCVDGASDSSKILKNDTNATNVIDCANNGTLAYTIGAGGGGTTNPGNGTPVPTISTLPKTGLSDSMVKYGLPSAVLLLIGIGAKLLIL